MTMDQQESGDESEGANDKQCKVCKKVFARRSHVLRHMLCHNDQRPYQCLQCELAFKQKAHLDRHVERFHVSSSSSSAEKRFKCLVCLKLFRTAYERHRHCKVMHSGAGVSTDQPNYRCKICGRTNFSTIQQLDNHIQWHSGRRTFVCCYCNMAFRRRFVLEIHYQSQHGRLRWKCVVCRQLFRQRVQVERHCRRVHKEQRAPSSPKQLEPGKRFCIHCDQVVDSIHLKRHIQRMHFFQVKIPIKASRKQQQQQQEQQLIANVEDVDPGIPSQEVKHAEAVRPDCDACTIALLVHIHEHCQPLSRLKLHSFLPLDILERDPNLVNCELDMLTDVKPGQNVLLFLPVSCTCAKPQTSSRSEKFGYKIIYTANTA
ncbi:Zinc finger protein [Trichinella pseudospiralis]|uniref:Zinc finger protein n=2 Tax=Trichinella pseudospiralis TaxID=6337 RepID=A0A0V1E9Z6_TRIPS|nr:Zinc finger protein [Trichinella pseudospiralis]KRZ29395.1 Zinc finger protein [Trichinella pseudospiralis]KRZ38531.1 Zinc finger protein [Trichinella pseudospiralis]